MSKPELQKLAKQLKEEILNLRSQVKQESAKDPVELTETAVSVISLDGISTLVKIKFNAEAKVAEIDEIVPFPNQTHMALFRANEILNTEVFLKRR